jgi:uncharacterized repeat protein (TIGR01451 family)
MKALITLSTALMLSLASNHALADIELTTISELEITEVNAQGVKTVKRVPAKTVVPGSIVVYTITAKNTGAQPADNVVVTNPIPQQMRYIDGSATGAGTDITFSVDGGKKYAQPEKLNVKDATGKPRPATPEDYTHVRWTFTSSLQAGQATPVSYRAQVK